MKSGEVLGDNLGGTSVSRGLAGNVKGAPAVCVMCHWDCRPGGVGGTAARGGLENV